MISKPTILFVSTVSTPRNGVGQIVRALADACEKEDMRSVVFTGRGQSGDADFVSNGRTGFYRNVFMARFLKQDGFMDVASARRLNERILELKPDLVHLHNLHGYYTHLPSLGETLDKLDVPVIVTLHDLWFATGRCAWPWCGDPEYCTADCSQCKFPNSYPAKWLPGRSMRKDKEEFLQGKHVVVPSRWMFERLEKHTPVIIPNGVDKLIFKPYENVRRDSSMLLAVATKWNHTKGIEDIAELAQVLPEELKIVLVGNNALHHPRIKSLGYIDDARKIAQLMAQSRAVLSASHHEAFGMTVAEALATQTPVIARAGTAAAELISDKRFAVDFMHPQSVVKAIMNTDSYMFGENVISTREMTQKYIGLYKKLLGI